MKNKIFTMMLISASLLFANRSNAQLNININIGNQPAWAPEGFDNAQYYYMPDIDVYYDIPAHQFVYMNNNRWMRAASLPAAYRGYDLYHIHKVPLNQKNAYLNHDRDRKQYVQFRGKFDQQPIRDSHNEKYSSNKNNWQENKFRNDRQDKGRDNHHQDDRHSNNSRG